MDWHRSESGAQQQTTAAAIAVVCLILSAYFFVLDAAIFLEYKTVSQKM